MDIEIVDLDNLSQRSTPNLVVDISFSSQTLENGDCSPDDQACNSQIFISENFHQSSQSTVLLLPSPPSLPTTSSEYFSSNKKEKTMNKCSFGYNYHTPSINDYSSSHHQFFGLFSNDEGEIRFAPFENFLSFGYQPQKIAQIMKRKNQSIFEIDYHTQFVTSKLNSSNGSEFPEFLRESLRNSVERESILKQISEINSRFTKPQKCESSTSPMKESELNIPGIKKRGITKEPKNKTLTKKTNKPNVKPSKSSKKKMEFNGEEKLKKEPEEKVLKEDNADFEEEEDLINQNEKIFQQCYNLIGEQVMESNPMFIYNIGRMNKKTKLMESVRSGHSRQFQELLGASEDTLSALVLRQQKINLVRDYQNSQALLDFQYLLEAIASNEPQSNESTAEIVTLDNFGIRIFIKKQYFSISGSEEESSRFNNNSQYQYYLVVAEIDIDLTQLENLIEYRQNIHSNPNNFEFHSAKELSQKFEDVEYSVLSQSFIENYYSDKLEKILNQEQYVLFLSSKNKHRPTYRYI